MAQWWCVLAGEQVGPLEWDQLRQLAIDGKLTRADSLWTAGLQRWVKAGEYPELAARIFAPPPHEVPTTHHSLVGVAPSSTPIEAVTLPEEQRPLPLLSHRSNPWQRFLGKFVDFYIAIVVAVGILIGLAFLSPPFQIWFQDPRNGSIVGIATLLVTPVIEAAFASSFGNSPGKALMGVRVHSLDSKALTFSALLIRNFRVAWFGMGAFVFSLFTCIYQYRRLKLDGRTPYDTGRYLLETSHVSAVRYLAAICFIATSYIASAYLNADEKEQSRRFAEGHEWRNPFNQRKIAIPSGWIVAEQKNSLGHTIFTFTRPSEELHVVYGRQAMPATGADVYISAFLKSVQSDMLLTPPGSPDSIGLHEAWTIRGRLTADSTQKVSVTFLPHDEYVWRTVAVRMRGADPETASYLRLRELLLLASASTPDRR